MFSYKARIEVDRNSDQPLYLQLSHQIIELIKHQTLAPKTKLPSTRSLSEQLSVHRKTVVACYEELTLQGWIESIPKKGTFVLESMPVLIQQRIGDTEPESAKEKARFNINTNKNLVTKSSKKKKDGFIYLRDGIPDVRLTPIDQIARTYRRICSRKSVYEHLSYGTTYGNSKLREILAEYLNSTRGLNITKENVLITRGSQMAIWLSSQLILQKDDRVVVGDSNYDSADVTFLTMNAKLSKVSVDENGIVTDEIEAICKKRQIKAVYVTSHHHHPTTVVLSAKRRIHLLNLARQYGFAIMEDDYDFDFNYNRAPILPLASHDSNGNVIYIGSFCKTVAPVYRVGYMIASKDVVDEASKIRGIIDRQGDAILELAFADFIKSGDLDRHIRKVVKIYKQRRDLFCHLLARDLGSLVQFEIPIGGMAVWAKLNSKFPWDAISKLGEKHQIEITPEQYYADTDKDHAYLRLGFSEHNEAEIKELAERLKKVISELE